MMSTPKTDAKRAELHELFERLSSRRIRSIKPEDTPTDATTPSKAAMDPSLKRLSTIIKGTSTIGGRPRRNTVAVASIVATDNSNVNDMHLSEAFQSEEGPQDAESMAKFSLANEKKYPFTFKHMLHKLYNKDDWGRAIKEMLEKSKNEFKPLAELEKTATKGEEKKDEKQVAKKEEKEAGVVRFQVVLPSGSGGKRNSIGGRQRSHSVVGVGRTPSVPLSPTLRSPSVSAGVIPPEGNRALKKRCVGRRKSMSGALNGSEPVVGLRSRGNWVYDAAISSSERPAPSSSKFMAFPHVSPPSPIITGRTGFESKNAVSIKRKVGTMVRKRSVSASFAMVPNKVPIMMPLQQVTNFNTNGLVARRRRLGEKDEKEEKEETNKKPAKRPFAA